MMLRHLLLLCLMAFSAGTLRAADNCLRDSLLIQLKETPHNEQRLKILLRLSLATDENMEESSLYNQQMLEEAELQNNTRYKCEAYLTEVIYAYNTYDQEKLQQMADLLIPLARKEGHYDLMFRGWRCKIDFLLLTQDFERNEREVKKMLAEAQRLNNTIGLLEAYQCYANVYRITHRKEDAIRILEQANTLGSSTNNDINYLSNIWQQLFFLYAETGLHAPWITLLKEAEKSINRLSAAERSSQHLTLLILYTSYTEYYLQVENPERAKRYMAIAETFQNDSNSPLYNIYFEKVSSQVYCKSGLYDKALERVNAAIAHMQSISSNEDYHDILPYKAHILNQIGRHEDAIHQLKEVIAFKDSIQVVTINKQYEQLRKDFNADHKLLKEAELHHRLQLLTVTLLIIGMIVIAAFIVYLLRSHRTLRNAEQQMRTMNEQMDLASEAKNRFVSNISTTIREPLNTVVDGSLRLANRQVSDPEEQQSLSVSIRTMAASLLKMVNDILDLSRLESGMMKFEMGDIEITSLLSDAARSQENTSDQIQIESEYPENTLYMVHADGNRLLSIFKSLFSRDGKQITVWLREQEGNVFQVSVSGSSLTRMASEQEIIIRNEINRMLILHFGGTYTIGDDQITLTLPVTERISPDAES